MQPQDEDALEGEVPGEVVENDAEREALKEVEEAEDDPVSEPLNVVVGRRRLDGLDREVGGHCPAEDVRDRGGEAVDSVENEEEDYTTEERIALGDLCALLNRGEGGVLGKLWNVTRRVSR